MGLIFPFLVMFVILLAVIKIPVTLNCRPDCYYGSNIINEWEPKPSRILLCTLPPWL